MTRKTCSRLALVLAAGVAVATVVRGGQPTKLDDDFTSENKCTTLHGSGTPAAAAEEAKKKLAFTTPVALAPNAIDGRDTPRLAAMAGQILTVHGVITSVYHSEKSDARFFNFAEDRKGFSFVIFSSAVKNFELVGDPLDFYLHKKVQVTGLVTIHKGRPSMVVTKPEQISLVR
jgi:hypothetical protein